MASGRATNEAEAPQLRIVILEWICGGGLCDTEPRLVADSLLKEGRAMLNAVALDFLSSGHEVSVSIDARLSERLNLFDHSSHIRKNFCTEFANGLPLTWWRMAADVDAAVVIAPEFSSILQTAVSQLAPVCKLLNSKGDFLNASSDKLFTAQRLDKARIQHPATLLTSDATETWLQQHRNGTGKWIVKPRDGAGCDAIQLASDDVIRDVLSAVRTSETNTKMIIQPLHRGSAFSRSAIVDSARRAHWLPLVTQELTIMESIAYSGGRVLEMNGLHYEDRLNGKRYSIERLDDLLNAALEAMGPGALGWVGVDLLYSDELDDWMVIEINPRLTTSFTGLSHSYGPGLMEQMRRAAQGLEVTIQPKWKPVAFNSTGALQ